MNELKSFWIFTRSASTFAATLGVTAGWQFVPLLCRHAEPPNQQRIEGSPTARIASVAGRGPFDDVVSAMLVQLLAQRGVAARRISHASVSRETIAQLDLSAVQVIAVSHLEVGGAPAHLRYLIRRLRQRAPHSTLIAGLWAQGDPVLNDPHAQKALGGDRYVGSLREAIDASLASLSDPSPT